MGKASKRHTLPLSTLLQALWLTDLYVACCCGHLRPASTTTVSAHHRILLAAWLRHSDCSVRLLWPTLFEPVGSSTTSIRLTASNLHLTCSMTKLWSGSILNEWLGCLLFCRFRFSSWRNRTIEQPRCFCLKYFIASFCLKIHTKIFLSHLYLCI